MRKIRRHTLIFLSLPVLLAASHAYMGDTVLAFAFGGVVALTLVVVPLFTRWARANMMRAIELNAPLAELDDPRP